MARRFHNSRSYELEVLEVVKADAEVEGADATVGEFRGLASVFGNEDLQGEVVDKGAFKKSIKESRGKVRMLRDHDRSMFLGIAEVSENEKGLLVDPGRINLEKQIGKEAFSDIRFSLSQKLPMEMSIGFNIIDEKVEGDVIHLKQIDLKEVSIVTFAANPQATVLETMGVDGWCDAIKGFMDEAKSGRAFSLRDVRSLKRLVAAGFELVDEKAQPELLEELRSLLPKDVKAEDAARLAIKKSLDTLAQSMRGPKKEEK